MAARASRGSEREEALVHHGITLIVPTRNEACNIRELLRRLSHVAPGVLDELVFVDDSDDDTPHVIRDEAGRSAVPVQVIHRPRGQRGGGLGGAVLAGFGEARSRWLGVMDADLQHPPELLPALLRAGEEAEADIVCATRYAGNGDGRALGRTRGAISRLSGGFARLLFPRALRGSTDPMSGFFLVRRCAVELTSLRPTGFKIFLEILVRFGSRRLVEVPYDFGHRFAGTTKASPAQGVAFVRHLMRLRMGPVSRWAGSAAVAARFGAVGLVGLVVNQMLLWLFVSRFGIGYALGAILATQGSTTTNFLLADGWVFRGATRGSPWRRFLQFSAVNNAALVLRVPALALLVSGLGVHYLLANLITLVLLFASRFAVSDRLIWRPIPAPLDEEHRMLEPTRISTDAVVAHRQNGAVPSATPDRKPSVPPRRRRVPAPAPRHHYDVGGILAVESEVPLPELRWCEREGATAPADIVIRRGRAGRYRPVRRTSVLVAAGSVLYQEHLGALASNFAVEMGDPIEVTISPLLAASPHVAYTNVVEALLRFALVSRGYMLLHSATFVLGGRGVMLSARTDTGKTGTILRLMREQGGVFLSDDMTILGPDRVARCYPKPLTISAHTLRAVDPRALRRPERVRLAVQSRVHSKGGRLLGTRIAELNLPIMALNALTQRVVPPPKYEIERLVPCRMGGSTPVSELFLIERGAPGLEDVDRAAALDELIANTDDAYGCPPFASFAPANAIGDDGYLTLREKERAILERALREIRVRRVVSDDYSWADTIPTLLAAEGRQPAPADAPWARGQEGNGHSPTPATAPEALG